MKRKGNADYSGEEKYTERYQSRIRDSKKADFFKHVGVLKKVRQWIID